MKDRVPQDDSRDMRAEESGARAPDAVEREKAHYDEHRRYLLHFLERDGSAFDRWLIRQTLKTWDRQFAFIDPELVRGRTVVEVGCGNPRVLFLFKQMGARRVIGVDLSERFVKRGLSRPRSYVYTYAVECRPDDVKLLFGDFTGPLGRTLEADVVACFQSLHHMELAAFVDTCAHILGPGGKVVISDPVGDHPLRWLGNLVGRAYGLLSPDERAISPKLVISRFEEAGFELESFRSLNPALEIYFHLTELLAPVSPALAFYAKLPMAVLRPLEDFLEATLLRLFPRLGWRYYAVFRKVG